MRRLSVQLVGKWHGCHLLKRIQPAARSLSPSVAEKSHTPGLNSKMAAPKGAAISLSPKV